MVSIRSVVMLDIWMSGGDEGRSSISMARIDVSKTVEKDGLQWDGLGDAIAMGELIGGGTM